jgi:excisionase family DNA binding protein
MTTRRTEITIETSRRLVVRRSKDRRTSWCDRCLAEVRMITPEEAAALIDVSSRSIYQWIEAGSVHFHEDRTRLLVCAESLPLTTGTRNQDY